MEILMVLFLPLVFVVGSFIFGWIRKLDEYERGIVFRLGRLQKEPKGPGLMLLVAPPFIDRMVKVELRTVILEVPPQDIITKDNVSVKVSAVVSYRVIDPVKAVMEVENYHYATLQKAQTSLRTIMGSSDLDDLLANREKISNEIQVILDEQTEPYGVKVSNAEMKNVDLPIDMQRAMARQAEAERERRAKVISAEGEYQAAEKLVEAAKIMAEHPAALQMRYLQTAAEIGVEKNTTILFPLPLELTKLFQK